MRVKAFVLACLIININININDENATNTDDLTQSEQNVSHFLYFDVITLHFGGIPSCLIWSSVKCISVLRI